MRTAAALLVAALMAAPARAEDSGLTMGARVGLGFSFGKVDGRTASTISDYVPSAFPLWLELGYRFDLHWSLTGFFQYALTTTADCPPGEQCTASDQRLGLTAIYRLDPASFRGWMGIGTGYEWFNLTRGAELHAGGLELNLQAGGDFQVSSTFRLGPYLCLSVSKFTQVTPQVDVDKTTHGWVQVGLKGAFDL